MRNFNIINMHSLYSTTISEENLQPCKASAYVPAYELADVETGHMSYVAYLADFNVSAPLLYNGEHVLVCAERTAPNILANLLLTTENVAEKGVYSVLPEVCFGRPDNMDYQGVMSAVVIGVAAASTPNAAKKLGRIRLLVITKNAKGELVFGSVFADQDIRNTRYVHAYDFRVIEGGYFDITEEMEESFENIIGVVTPEVVKELRQLLDEAAAVAKENPLDKSFIDRC